MKKLLENWRRFVNEEYVDPGYSEGGFWGHMGSGCLFVTDDKVFLLQRGKNIQQPLQWGSVGGSVPVDDETGKYQNAWESALREVEEECGSLPPGMSAKAPRPLINKVDKDFRYYNYIVQLPKEAEQWNVKIDHESNDFGWFSWDELPEPLHFGVKWLFGKMGKAK